jgi:hypothetical protein
LDERAGVRLMQLHPNAIANRAAEGNHNPPLIFEREKQLLVHETKLKSAVVMLGRSSLAELLLRCSHRVRFSAAFKFLLVASFIVWGCFFMYYKGESDYNMVYVAGQCLWKSYGNLEKYSKSGLEFPCVTNVLQRSSQDSHGGFFDTEFPTDKVRDVTWFFLEYSLQIAY